MFSSVYSTAVRGEEYGVSVYPYTNQLIELIVNPLKFFSLILIVFTTEQQALGYTNESNQEEYLDFQPYTGNRLMVFNDTSIDYCVTNNDENPIFNHIAANAIQTWQDRIIDVTNNPFVWDMTMHIQPKDQSICDGFVNYVSTPDPTVFQLSGVAGFSHPLTPVANVTIYTDDYQSTL